jgi:hypothetical protein
MPRDEDMVAERIQQAERIQRLEEALYGTGRGAATQMCRDLGIKIQRWHNVKSGRGLSVEMTSILVRRIPGLTSDWLLFGYWRTLTGEMLEKLYTRQNGKDVPNPKNVTEETLTRAVKMALRELARPDGGDVGAPSRPAKWKRRAQPEKRHRRKFD